MTNLPELSKEPKSLVQEFKRDTNSEEWRLARINLDRARVTFAYACDRFGLQSAQAGDSLQALRKALEAFEVVNGPCNHQPTSEQQSAKALKGVESRWYMIIDGVRVRRSFRYKDGRTIKSPLESPRTTDI